MTQQTIKKFHHHLGETKPVDIVTQTVIINDGSNNVADLPITLTGTNVPNYSTHVLEAFAWILGNFAYSSAPNKPIHGQTWYNTSTNTLQLYIGKDHENGVADWFPIEPISFHTVKTDIIPNATQTFDIGSSEVKWPEMSAGLLTSFSDIYVNDIHVSSFIPSDTKHISNASSAEGETVADVLTIFSELANSTIPKTVTTDDVLTTTIAPEDESRYRTTTDSDITVTIDQMVGSVEDFMLYAAGNGNIKLQAGVGVEITQSQPGEFATAMLFKTIGVNKWLVFGNFGDYI